MTIYLSKVLLKSQLDDLTSLSESHSKLSTQSYLSEKIISELIYYIPGILGSYAFSPHSALSHLLCLYAKLYISSAIVVKLSHKACLMSILNFESLGTMIHKFYYDATTFKILTEGINRYTPCIHHKNNNNIVEFREIRLYNCTTIFQRSELTLL